MRKWSEQTKKYHMITYMWNLKKLNFVENREQNGGLPWGGGTGEALFKGADFQVVGEYVPEI